MSAHILIIRNFVRAPACVGCVRSVQAQGQQPCVTPNYGQRSCLKAPSANPMTGQEAIDTLPASVRIGALDYTIEVVQDNWSGESQWGELDYDTLTMRLKHKQPSPVFACDTFIHEVLHAIYREKLEDGDPEERIVNGFGQGITQLFKDNVWLPGWVAVAVRG